jgi:hypothetical protein
MHARVDARAAPSRAPGSALAFRDSVAALMLASPRHAPPRSSSRRLAFPLLALLAGCAGASPPPAITPRETPRPILPPPPWQARLSVAEGYEAKLAAAPPVVIRGATLLLATGRTIARGTIILDKGKIAVGLRGRRPHPRGHARHRRNGQVRHAGHPGHPLSPRRLSHDRGRRARGRQRDGQSLTPHAQTRRRASGRKIQASSAPSRGESRPSRCSPARATSSAAAP